METLDLGSEASIEMLEAIRSECPVLNAVFLPDDVWLNFKSWHSQPDPVALHRSILLLALKRGHLTRVTSPIHRYLIDAGCLRPNVRRQYVQDLRERWIHDPDPIKRHHKSKMFIGRLTELQCAEWLEEQGWVVTGLEALRKGPDIEASLAGEPEAAFEVKFIGQEDKDFKNILRSIETKLPSEGRSWAYAGVNYLLLRVYEAAKQLVRVNKRRIAIVVIDDTTTEWDRYFKKQLKQNWIDWANSRFLGQNPDWEAFIREQESSKYPALRSELASVVRQIDAVWIIRRTSEHQDHLEYELSTRPTGL